MMIDYPRAIHTRSSHGLVVIHIAGRIVDMLSEFQYNKGQRGIRNSLKANMNLSFHRFRCCSVPPDSSTRRVVIKLLGTQETCVMSHNVVDLLKNHFHLFEQLSV